MTILDTFSRITASGWGSADSGEAWTTSGGSAANYSTSGGRGRMSLSTLNVNREARLASTSYVNVDITVLHTGIDQVPVGGNFEISVLARYVNSTNYVDFRVFRSPAGVTCAVRQVVAGVETVTGFPSVSGALNNSDLSLRLQVVGSTLRGRAWKRGTTEPTTWPASMTTTLLSAGQIGLKAFADTPVTNTLPVEITFDDLSVQVTGFATTANALPYPEPSDRFCDGWLFTQRLAERVDTLLDDLDTQLAFLVRPPFARLSIEVPYDYTYSTKLTYTDADLDTANLVDLSRDPGGIIYDREELEGRWMVGAYLRHLTGGTAGARGQLNIWAANSNFTGSSVRDQGVGLQPRVATTGSFRVSDPQPTESFYANYSEFGVSVLSVSIQEQYMFAWRFSD